MQDAIDESPPGVMRLCLDLSRRPGSIQVFRLVRTGVESRDARPFHRRSTHDRGGERLGPEAQFRFESYTTPTTLYRSG